VSLTALSKRVHSDEAISPRRKCFLLMTTLTIISCCTVSVTIPDLLTVKMEIFHCLRSVNITNLDIKDAACLHIVHNLQHPTSRPTTKSTQTTTVNAPQTDCSTLPVGQYGKSTQRSTEQYYHANEGKSGLEAERVRALGALRSLRSKRKLEAEK